MDWHVKKSKMAVICYPTLKGCTTVMVGWLCTLCEHHNTTHEPINVLFCIFQEVYVCLFD